MGLTLDQANQIICREQIDEAFARGKAAGIAEERAKRDLARGMLRSLATQAVNGWAIYAKSELERQDILRLHREIDAVSSGSEETPHE